MGDDLTAGTLSNLRLVYETKESLVHNKTDFTTDWLIDWL